MNFKEAIEKLESGTKVTRESWNGSIYFSIENCEVKSYQPALSPFVYNEDIMISDGWIILDKPNFYEFYEIIPFLQTGHKAKLHYWTEDYIFYDRESCSLILKSTVLFNYMPSFSDFIAEDWVVLE